jgi:hypothetical protein
MMGEMPPQETIGAIQSVSCRRNRDPERERVCARRGRVTLENGALHVARNQSGH